MNVGGEGETSPPGAPATRAAEIADPLRILGWILTKLAYVFVPFRLLLQFAKLQGAIDGLRSADRLLTIEGVGRPLGERDLRGVSRRHLQFRRRAQLVRIWPQISDLDGAKAIEIDGLEHLDMALAAGKGAILTSGHFGYNRMIKPTLAACGRRALLVGPSMSSTWRRPVGARLPAPPHRTRLGEYVYSHMLRLPDPLQNLRPHLAATEMRVDLPAGLNVRPLVDALAHNQTLIILVDGRQSQALRKIPMLGLDVDFSPGAVSLARATGAAALPAFLVDESGLRNRMGLRLMIHPPLYLQVSANAAADHEENLRRLARVYEQEVRSHPHLWYEWGSEWQVARLAFREGFATIGPRQARLAKS